MKKTTKYLIYASLILIVGIFVGYMVNNVSELSFSSGYVNKDGAKYKYQKYSTYFTEVFFDNGLLLNNYLKKTYSNNYVVYRNDYSSEIIVVFDSSKLKQKYFVIGRVVADGTLIVYQQVETDADGLSLLKRMFISNFFQQKEYNIEPSNINGIINKKWFYNKDLLGMSTKGGI